MKIENSNQKAPDHKDYISSQVKKQTLHGWSRTTKSNSTVLNAYTEFHDQSPVIPRGSGLSYGDASLNQSGYVLVGSQPQIRIDEVHGRVEVSTEVQLSTLLNYLADHGYSLKVLPGSSRITIGGCIAANIHGKNHHIFGSFSQIVHGFWLIARPDEKEIYCDRQKNKNLFEGTLGGMGLTGFVTRASLTISPLPTSASLLYQDFQNLEELFKEIEKLRASEWNALALINWNEGVEGKGKLIKYQLNYDESRKMTKLLKSRNFLPLQFKFINKITIWFYNKLQFTSHNKLEKVNPYSLIFMADRNRNANLWFGKKGFIEYQFSVPRESVELAIKIMRDFNKNFTIYLSGIKLISDKSVSLLNFYQNGYTITLTTTPSQILYKQLDEYDLLLSESGGKVYLPKDSRMNHENFSRMYGGLSAFKNLRTRLGLRIFQSDLSQRLKI